jgi:hypothetical protein
MESCLALSTPALYYSVPDFEDEDEDDEDDEDDENLNGKAASSSFHR